MRRRSIAVAADFKPSKFLSAPRAILTLGAVCADTQAEAERLAASTKLLIRRIRLGGPRMPVPTPEDAIAELETLGEDADPLAWVASEWPRYIVGDAKKVSGVLQSMGKELNVDELMILTVIHDHRARAHSYELLAQAFGLMKAT